MRSIDRPTSPGGVVCPGACGFTNPATIKRMSPEASIYLDYAAATPLDERVLLAMEPFWRAQFFNPSSPYLAAKGVRAAIEDARGRVAHWIGARPSEIIFTAGATESINMAIHGVMRQFSSANVVTTTIEHPAVLESAQQYSCRLAGVKPDGLLDVQALRRVIDDQTVLVSIGYVNNEIGTIQPLREIAELVADIRRLRRLGNNDLPLYIHTDASQAASYLDLHASRLGVDLLTLNGGKMYGPKQTGVLYVKAGLSLVPLISGGGQESALRSGTENVPGSIGLSEALDYVQEDRRDAIAKHAMLRDELERRLQAVFPDMVVNGNRKKRIPNNLHVSWPGIDGERLVMLLDERGVQVATGSACAANKQTASHVLKSIGLDGLLLAGSLRISLGVPTMPEDIVRAAEVIIQSVHALRR